MSATPVNIDRMDARINKLGSSLFFDEITLQHSAERGVDNMVVLYAAGRAGVMGDVTAAQVTSAFAFFAPGMVREVWSSVGTGSVPPASAIASIYAEAMSAAARERWVAEPAATVTQIGRVVLDRVDPLGMALFAGWREMAVPADPLGAAAVTIMALRELRGDVHVQSVAASGLTALEAEMATRGVLGAELHGWKPPYPEPEPIAEVMAAAQADTSRRMAKLYATLSSIELADLDEAVRTLAPR